MAIALGMLVNFVAVGLLMAVINWISLIPWRRASQLHWAERARILHPVRVTARLLPFLLATLFSSADGIWQWVPETTFKVWCASYLAGVLGGTLATYTISRETYPDITFLNWLHQWIGWMGIQFAIILPMLAATFMMPIYFGWWMVLIIASYLSCHFALQFGLFLKYLQLVKLCRTAGQRLQAIVDKTEQGFHLKVRATWQLNVLIANAVAFPVTTELAFTDRLLDICTDEELAAVCAHELGHLSESKWVLAARLAGSLTLLPIIFTRVFICRLGGIGMVVPIILMFVMSILVRMLSQRMEKRADQLAIQTQTTTGIYASALEKLYRENQSPVVNASNRHTHPHLYDRMTAAGVTPDYPRPRKPKRFTLPGWVALLVFVGFVLWLFTRPMGSRNQYDHPNIPGNQTQSADPSN